MGNKTIVTGPEKIQADLLPLAVAISDPILDPRNAREHPEENLDQIKLSLLRFGQCKPVVINRRTGIIVAGNGLVLAARELGWLRVAVARVDLTDNEALAYGIMDNKSGLSSTWNLPNLKDVLQELDTGEFDMKLTGFNEIEIEELMTQTFQPTAGQTDDDAMPEEVSPVCKVGELWQLGEHRLLCGDATKREEVERLMQGEKADMVFTDPPYGINLIKVEGGKVGGGTMKYPTKRFPKMIGDNKPFQPNCLFGLSKDIVLFGGNYCADKLPNSKCWFVWDKNHPVDRTFAGCELMWTNLDRHSKVFNCTWDGYTKQGESGKKIHPAQKPVLLLTDILSEITIIGELVLDPFGGSGSTLIACEKLQRKCRMMEIDPHYCDVIITRWQNFTGRKAELLK